MSCFAVATMQAQLGPFIANDDEINRQVMRLLLDRLDQLS
jgi:hypothetical protein